MHASKKLAVCTFSLWAVGECHHAATATALNPDSTMASLSQNVATLEDQAIAAVTAVLPPPLIAIAQPERQPQPDTSRITRPNPPRIASTDASGPGSPAVTTEPALELQATDFPTPDWSAQSERSVSRTAPTPAASRQRLIPVVRVPDLPPRPADQPATTPPIPAPEIASTLGTSTIAAPSLTTPSLATPTPSITTPTGAASVVTITGMSSPGPRSLPILSSQQQQARAAYSQALQAWAAGIRSCLQGNIPPANGAANRSQPLCPVAKFTAVRPY